MLFLQKVASVVALFLVSASAINIPPAHLQARNDVSNAEAVLIALRASAFCSSFVPITDVTSTVTQTKTPTPLTVTAACTNAHKKRFFWGESAKPSTTSKSATTQAVSSTTPKISTTPAAPSISSKTSTSSVSIKAATTTSACAIKGAPPQLAIFACDIIDEACRAFVQPKTTTVSKLIMRWIVRWWRILNAGGHLYLFQSGTTDWLCSFI